MELKFRQPIYVGGKFVHFHYWGFVGTASVGPQTQRPDMEAAQSMSEPFTGRRDKNNREIFKGDIVRVHQFLFDGSEYESECKGVVGYCEESMAFTLSQIEGKEIEEYTGHPKGKGELPFCYFHGLHEESFEVIGSVHQPPSFEAEAVRAEIRAEG